MILILGMDLMLMKKMRFIISSKMKVIFRALFGQHYL